jgi:hypothetical protein
VSLSIEIEHMTFGSYFIFCASSNEYCNHTKLGEAREAALRNPSAATPPQRPVALTLSLLRHLSGNASTPATAEAQQSQNRIGAAHDCHDCAMESALSRRRAGHRVR